MRHLLCNRSRVIWGTHTPGHSGFHSIFGPRDLILNHVIDRKKTGNQSICSQILLKEEGLSAAHKDLIRLLTPNSSENVFSAPRCVRVCFGIFLGYKDIFWEYNSPRYHTLILSNSFWAQNSKHNVMYNYVISYMPLCFEESLLLFVPLWTAPMCPYVPRNMRNRQHSNSRCC